MMMRSAHGAKNIGKTIKGRTFDMLIHTDIDKMSIKSYKLKEIFDNKK